MKKLFAYLLPVIVSIALGACGKQQPAPTSAEPAAPPAATAPAAPPPAEEVPAPATSSEQSTSAATAPVESVSETDDSQEASDQSTTTAQSALQLGSASSSPTSERFKEGTHYKKLVPAQPTGAAPDKVEVVEAFWYGCGHCFTLDPAIESWRSKNKARHLAFVRVPAMWNDATRMHARMFYTAELLGKLDAVHSPMFREIHVNNNPLNTVEKITAFFKQHGVSAEEFQKAFSSFAVESKLQRADVLNRRYRVQSVPMFIVNGKYTTDVSEAGGEAQLFTLLDELIAHEHGG